MTVSVVTGVAVTAETRVATALGQAGGVRLARRCPDLADLLSVVEAGRADAAVVSAELPGLDRSTLARLRATGIAVIGLYTAGDEQQQRALLQWGLRACLADDAAAEELAEMIRSEAAGSGAHRQPPLAEPVAEPVHDEAEPVSDPLVVTVWGPVGAPGRTTVAVNLAAEIARLGTTALLVDADTYGASVAQHVALLDEAPGLAAATRLADAGTLDLHRLAAVAPEAAPGMRVLTGLPRADRWPEVREAAFEEVLSQAVRLARVTVIDVSAPLEDDEELSYDTLAPRRNAVTRAALRCATTVLAVGSADPVGLQRLVRGLDELQSVVTDSPRVVVTKVRASAVGTAPDRKVAEALERFAGIPEVLTIPDDRDGLDRALLSGRLLCESAPSSPAREAIAALAADLTGEGAPPRIRRRSWRRLA